jgi:hypothetical protein
MKAKTFAQASYQWSCYIQDNMGAVMNEHSYPYEELSEEKKTVWILKNNYGVLCVVDKQTGEVIT